ncbi:MAG: hypothetical protein EB075_02240 [Bacteroidetes bacterium]|nr:hypothetical protein [Bacteroidota bacterium]
MIGLSSSINITSAQDASAERPAPLSQENGTIIVNDGYVQLSEDAFRLITTALVACENTVDVYASLEQRHEELAAVQDAIAAELTSQRNQSDAALSTCSQLVTDYARVKKDHDRALLFWKLASGALLVSHILR